MNGLTFLSEYHPHKSVVTHATTPPGVDRIKVCLELSERMISDTKDSEKVCDELRVTEALDDDVADYENGEYTQHNAFGGNAQLLKPPFGMLAGSRVSTASTPVM